TIEVILDTEVDVLGTITVLITLNDDYSDTKVIDIIVKPIDDYNSNIPDGYYDDAEGLSGESLLIALNSILNDTYSYVSYGDARYILDESDKDPNNPNNVILVYTGNSVDGEWYCPGGSCTWNREHVWPQSLLNYDSTMTSDLHNLKPADPSENSTRGNKYYDYFTTNDTYEPRDEVKGDVARILFYMMVMYDELNLVDYAPGTYEMGLLQVLLEWHELDPVDDFERNRNDVIYSYQGNRNPFIDFPEYVDMIWG
ncbi:MAG: endonuclease, partial [Candidatus Izemoplasmatales bacterium]